jgi:O-acetyl-ADP-ribose deacetylase (regulator of RNase III)
MIKFATGDITTVTSGVIVQGVNCQGVMGKGLALDIRTKYPIVHENYKHFMDKWFEEHRKIPGTRSADLLGLVKYVMVSPHLIVANAFTQDTYGKDGRKYVSYDAVEQCLRHIRVAIDPNTVINMPLLGCGYGGGDWDVIQIFVMKILADRDVVIWTF